jgi:hypothetical protein
VTGLRGLGLLLGGAAVALVLCAGCRDSAAHTTSVPPTGTGSPVTVAGTAPGNSSGSDSSGGSSGSTGSPGDLGSQLDDIQSTLDGVQSQVDSDSTP